ncbi:MAG: alpha/beta hydrolase [Chitinophaga sp.]|uniref:alpha/beta fold hydrolase n=1 Tax=Chitinophaga sp. TaxID=1869181 RepID=UPI0025BFED2E|nr:alpha/beta hydrolase [Chitinophaga sp.]MBV8251929.1 alpha/beta hydrolase [Chitinophaga sp.]
MKKAFLLSCLLLTLLSAWSQDIPYGNNPAAGKYLTHKGAKLYYETYGTGRPLLLLHGDTYGYIEEFSQYIPILSQHFKVIAVGMRGHGKSELGNLPFSYQLFAEDAAAILRQETADSAIVMGFSAGAVTAYYLAAYYPGLVTKAVVLGGALNIKAYKPEALKELKAMNATIAEKQLPDVVAARKAIMPAPEKYGELIERLKATWFQEVYIPTAKAKAIKCPVMIVGGDSDDYFKVSGFLEAHEIIPNSQLAIIPHCGHIGLVLRPEYLTAVILPFMINN